MTGISDIYLEMSFIIRTFVKTKFTEMTRDEIIYIIDTIDWINNNSDLIDKNRTNCEALYAMWANSMSILERELNDIDLKKKYPIMPDDAARTSS